MLAGWRGIKFISTPPRRLMNIKRGKKMSGARIKWESSIFTTHPDFFLFRLESESLTYNWTAVLISISSSSAGIIKIKPREWPFDYMEMMHFGLKTCADKYSRAQSARARASLRPWGSARRADKGENQSYLCRRRIFGGCLPLNGWASYCCAILCTRAVWVIIACMSFFHPAHKEIPSQQKCLINNYTVLYYVRACIDCDSFFGQRLLPFHARLWREWNSEPQAFAKGWKCNQCFDMKQNTDWGMETSAIRRRNSSLLTDFEEDKILDVKMAFLAGKCQYFQWCHSKWTKNT